MEQITLLFPLNMISLWLCNFQKTYESQYPCRIQQFQIPPTSKVSWSYGDSEPKRALRGGGTVKLYTNVFEIAGLLGAQSELIETIARITVKKNCKNTLFYCKKA